MSASQLQEAVTAVFAAGGALSRAETQYRERGAQLELALAVADAIDQRSVLAAEAGTGVGKTFAYLVPVLLSGARGLISTATKSLQDQLFLRDLPRLREALSLPVTVALLKGRASYLCLQRLGQARQSAQLTDRFALRSLARIEEWAQRTASGDLAELDGLDERSPVIPLVSSTRENCLGGDCPQYRACHVMKARREAMAADLVVVNHHLFFADLALRDTGMAELLPSVDVAVFDEAHQLAEAGIAFLGDTLGTAQHFDFARDLLAVGLAQARGLQDWQALAQACEHAARELRLVAAGPLQGGGARGSLKLRWDERAGREDFQQALAALGVACGQAAGALDALADISPDFSKLTERARTLESRAQRFSAAAEPGRVRWIDLMAQSLRLVESPLDVRDAMRERIAAAPKAWIFTSATLGADERLRWFTEQTGLDDARTLRVDSPFDYPLNARLYVPARFPKPVDPGHAPAVARLAAACARAAGGRTFVLTTTLRALSAVADALQADFDGDAEPIVVLTQGSAPKRQLLQRFIDTPRAVLVGSQSFWEGIDVSGEALQCVIIDKLPFPPPNDPLVEARVKRLEAEGRNAFNDYFVAEAAVSLKQGAGRLIRSETDRGLLVICDPRMTAMGYGQKLRRALPPMQPLHEEREALAWLGEIAALPILW
ncbi:MAG: ATP-dependent DNA helicase [Methylibium sp.]|nr:ATP-dependent DNA helicase [Methylibium sp.]